MPVKKNTNFFEKMGPILLVVVVGLAFGVGVLWQKVSALEGSGSNTKSAGAVNPQAAAPQAPPEAGEVDPVADSDYVRGNRNARIALIEYSDLECPFCKSFHPPAQQAV